MATLFEMPGGSSGEVVFNGLTKVTGSGQTVSYSYASSLAGQEGDMLFGVNNTNNNYVLTSIPQQTVRIVSRYYIDPSNMTFGANDLFNLTHFRGDSFANRTHRIFIGNTASVFSISPLSYAEGNTDPRSAIFAVDKAPMYIETIFIRSSGVGVTDADYIVRVNGTQIYQRSTDVAPFANYTSFGLVNQCWMGGAAELDAGTSGTFTMGKIKITNDESWIGEYVPYNLEGSNQIIRRRRRSRH